MERRKGIRGRERRRERRGEGGENRTRESTRSSSEHDDFNIYIYNIYPILMNSIQIPLMNTEPKGKGMRLKQ